MYGISLRHRRPAQCRQVDPVQCADRDAGGAGGELSVLHDRAQRRPGRACPTRGSTSSPRIAGSAKIIPTQLGFVDIAGLVRGASQGRRARQPVPRQHPRGGRDRPRPALLRGRRHPARREQGRSDRRCRNGRDRTDAGRSRKPRKARPRRAKKASQRRQGEPSSSPRVLGQALDLLREGKPARLTQPKDEEEDRVFAQAQLLTAKPVLYVCNVDEEVGGERQRLLRAGVREGEGEGATRCWSRPRSRPSWSAWIPRSAMVFLEEMGLHETGLARIIRAGYDLLHLHHLLHRRPQGSPRLDRSPRAPRRPQAAGEIHSDFATRLHPCRDHRL